MIFRTPHFLKDNTYRTTFGRPCTKSILSTFVNIWPFVTFLPWRLMRCSYFFVSRPPKWKAHWKNATAFVQVCGRRPHSCMSLAHGDMWHRLLPGDNATIKLFVALSTQLTIPISYDYHAHFCTKFADADVMQPTQDTDWRLTGTSTAPFKSFWIIAIDQCLTGNYNCNYLALIASLSLFAFSLHKPQLYVHRLWLYER